MHRDLPVLLYLLSTIRSPSVGAGGGGAVPKTSIFVAATTGTRTTTGPMLTSANAL